MSQGSRLRSSHSLRRNDAAALAVRKACAPSDCRSVARPTPAALVACSAKLCAKAAIAKASMMKLANNIPASAERSPIIARAGERQLLAHAAREPLAALMGVWREPEPADQLVRRLARRRRPHAPEPGDEKARYSVGVSLS